MSSLTLAVSSSRVVGSSRQRVCGAEIKPSVFRLCLTGAAGAIQPGFLEGHGSERS